MFCVGVIIPITQTIIYERKIGIEITDKYIASINFTEELDKIRTE